MLIEFRVENHRSIRDEQVLTMEVGRTGNEADPRPRRVSGISEKLLPVGVIYGANASGKSNVLAALQFMRDAVLASQRAWPPEGGVPRDPFAWGSKKTEPSMFEVTVLVDGTRYQYGFVASDDHFLEEWLYAWPNGKKQVWFERDEAKFKFGENLKGENKVIEEVTRRNALFLSAAVQFKHESLQPIYEWFTRMLSIGLLPSQRLPVSAAFEPSEFFLERLLAYEGVHGQERFLFPDDEPSRALLERFRTLLKNADIGIVDLKVDRQDPEDFPKRRRRRIRLKHRSVSGDAWLPLDEESRGTQKLFRMGLPILQAMQVGGVVVVDELEASLHPMLAQQIVRLFNDPITNLEHTQLVFTTHDTNLLGTVLGEPALRRDQVWFTEKNLEGATVLYPLTDFKPRKAENLERGYLQGRYGAIPFLGDLVTFAEWVDNANPSA